MRLFLRPRVSSTLGILLLENWGSRLEVIHIETTLAALTTPPDAFAGGTGGDGEFTRKINKTYYPRFMNITVLRHT